MNHQELKEMIYNHDFTDTEISEAKSIVDILEQEGFDMVGDFTYKGRRIAPRSIGYDGAYRYITVVAIEKDGSYGFDYYIIETGDRDNGKVVETFETEADFIKAIISHIRAYTHNKSNRFHSKREELNEILEKAKERN